jgi:two-component system, LytTR family, sensor kinase
MPTQLKNIILLILGANNAGRIRVLLHIVFWVCMIKWLFFQSGWMLGTENSGAAHFIAYFRLLFVILCFYIMSAVPVIRLPNAWIWIIALVLLAAFFVLYCLMMYALCVYVNTHYTALPDVFKNIYESITANGPWTFMHSSLVFYFHFEQLGLAMLPAVTIKIFRLSLQSRLKSLSLEKNNLELELNFLRSQINPHFLFNTLNSLYALIEEKDAVAASIVSSLSDMMRYALYEANSAKVDISKELDFIKGYIDIQKVRYSNRLRVEMDFSPEIHNQQVPPLLLVTFLENAVKHGLDKMIQNCTIRIKAYNEGEKFCFFISNTKPAKASASGNAGIGIKNTERRLNILYPRRHILDIKQKDNEYSVLLKIW